MLFIWTNLTSLKKGNEGNAYYFAEERCYEDKRNSGRNRVECKNEITQIASTSAQTRFIDGFIVVAV
jgi:YHS domain-containing protein